LHSLGLNYGTKVYVFLIYNDACQPVLYVFPRRQVNTRNNGNYNRPFRVTGLFDTQNKLPGDGAVADLGRLWLSGGITGIKWIITTGKLTKFLKLRKLRGKVFRLQLYHNFPNGPAAFQQGMRFTYLFKLESFGYMGFDGAFC